MITIKYFNSIRGFQLDITGHSGNAEAGKDIVCAGVSTLANTLVLAGLKAKRKGYISKFRYSQEIGKMHMELRYSQLNFLFETVEIIIEALHNMANGYPEFITIEKIKER